MKSRLPIFSAIAAICIACVIGCTDDDAEFIIPEPINTFEDRDDDDAPDEPDTTAITAETFAQAKFGDRIVTMQLGEGGFRNTVEREIETLDEFTTTLRQTSTLSNVDSVSANAALTISFIFRNVFGERPDSNDINTTIQIGNLGFSSPDNQLNGVEIIWIDEKGGRWSSLGGSQDRNTSSFFFASHERKFVEDEPVSSNFFSTGRFTCRLYNESGDSIEVSGGRFALRTVLY